MKRGPEPFRLKIGGKEDKVSANRLKAAYYEEETTPAIPPRRGRPQKIVIPSPTPLRRPSGRPKKVFQLIPIATQPNRNRGRPHLIHQMDHRVTHLGGGVTAVPVKENNSAIQTLSVRYRVDQFNPFKSQEMLICG